MTSLTVRANRGTIEQRELARDITRWFAATHLAGHPRPVHVIINFSDAIRHYGSASWNGPTSYEANSYTITVRSNLGTRRLMVETVLHELVHVEQMARRDLLYFRDSTAAYRTFWQGVGSDHVDYVHQPWEREAYARERRLACEYLAARRGRRSQFV